MESIHLYLNSNIADKVFDNNIANAEYILPLIEIPDGFHIYLSVFFFGKNQFNLA